MSNKQIGNPLEQAVISGTIGKKSEPEQKTNGEQTQLQPVRQIGRKATKKDRVQHTIYLPPVISKWVKMESYEQGREISSIIADALVAYKEKKDTSNKY